MGELFFIVERRSIPAIGRECSISVADSLDDLNHGLALVRECDEKLRFPVHESPMYPSLSPLSMVSPFALQT